MEKREEKKQDFLEIKISLTHKNLIFLYINFMDDESSINKEILELEALKKRLLAENEILWDEVNAINRDVISLRRIFEKNKKTS